VPFKQCRKKFQVVSYKHDNSGLNRNFFLVLIAIFSRRISKLAIPFQVFGYELL